MGWKEEDIRVKTGCDQDLLAQDEEGIHGRSSEERRGGSERKRSEHVCSYCLLSVVTLVEICIYEKGCGRELELPESSVEYRESQKQCAS
jgi:hypothetical protein